MLKWVVNGPMPTVAGAEWYIVDWQSWFGQTAEVDPFRRLASSCQESVARGAATVNL